MTPNSSTRRGFLQKVSAGAAAVGAVPRTSSADNPARPNIVYLHSHDSGRYLQPYGCPVPTPNLQRLAAEGVLFRNAFSGAPTCSPSRAALLSGQCAHRSGMLGLAHRGFRMNDYNQHLVHTLRQASYHTVLAGIQHVASKPDLIGYDEIMRPRTMSAADVAPAAVAFLDKQPHTPFFLDVGFFETHREYPQPTPQDDPRFIQPPSPIPDTPATRLDTARYHASARILDDGVGLVLAALERNGLAANTLVISTTDHGIAFPRMKCNLEDAGWGVSLIMRGGRDFRGGQVCDRLVSHIDVFPTLCDLLSIERPSWLEGKSLMPVVRDEKEINEEVFAEVNYHAAYEPKRAVRTGRWKYIRRYGSMHTPVLPNCDDGLSKSLWLDLGWRNCVLPEESLYDLAFDPTEHENLARDGAAHGTLLEMRARLDRWMERTQDPLLRGPIPPPPGSEINDAEGTSPHEKTVRY